MNWWLNVDVTWGSCHSVLRTFRFMWHVTSVQIQKTSSVKQFKMSLPSSQGCTDLRDAHTVGGFQYISWQHVCALLLFLFFSCKSSNHREMRNICTQCVSFTPVLRVLYAMPITLNQQEKQDFLLGVEEKFIFHILLQAFSSSFFFWTTADLCLSPCHSCAQQRSNLGDNDITQNG